MCDWPSDGQAHSGLLSTVGAAALVLTALVVGLNILWSVPAQMAMRKARHVRMIARLSGS